MQPILRFIIFLIIFFWALPAIAAQRTSLSRNLLNVAESYALEVFSDSVAAARFEELARDATPDSTAYQAVIGYGRRMFAEGDQVLAMEYLRRISDIIEEQPYDDKSLKRLDLTCHLLLGAAAQELGMARLGMDFSFKGANMAEKAGDSIMLARFYNNTGVIQLTSDQLDDAEASFRNSLAINRQHDLRQEMFINHNNLAELEMKRNRPDRALDEIFQALLYIDCSTDSTDYYYLHSVIGQIYAKKNDFNLARACLGNSVSHLEHLPAKRELFDAYLSLAAVFNRVGLNDSAAIITQKAYALAEQMHNPQLLAEFNRQKAEMARERGDYRQAYEITLATSALLDSLNKAESRTHLDRMRALYDRERRQDRERSIIAGWNPEVVFFSMALCIVLMISFFLWAMRLRHRKHQAVSEALEATSQLNAIQQARMAEEADKQAQIRSELDLNNRKLSRLTLEQIRSVQTLDEVADTLKQMLINLAPRDKMRPSLQGAIDRLSRLASESDQWDDFQYYFEKVHPDFYRSLDHAHPELTEKDRRLCALIYLGLSTKDIASLTAREVRSVESSRLRLRKKLSLDTDEGLAEYLRAISRA